jgi:hypothetical protein
MFENNLKKNISMAQWWYLPGGDKLGAEWHPSQLGKGFAVA